MKAWIGLVAATATVLATASPARATLMYGTNAIVNGDAESGAGGTGGAVSVPGWTASGSGSMTVVRYGATVSSLSILDPGPGDRASNYFSGASNAVSGIFQVLDVSNAAAAINTGAVSYTLSAYLGGYLNQDDSATLKVTFSSGGTSLGTVSLNPVYASDRSNFSGLIARSATGFIPVGTDTLTFILTATRTAGTYNDGYADDLSFVALNTAPVSVPEPGTLALLGVSLVGLGAMRRWRWL